jgi:hypothetical protein
MLVKSRAAGAVLLDRICAASRAENRAAGERLAAIGGLDLLRLGEFGDCDDWSTDTQEAVTAEVAAALRISQGLAASYRYYSRAMRNRRPTIAALIIELEQASRTAAKPSAPNYFRCSPTPIKPLQRCWSKSATVAPDGSPRTAPSLQPNEAAIPR